MSVYVRMHLGGVGMMSAMTGTVILERRGAPSPGSGGDTIVNVTLPAQPVARLTHRLLPGQHMRP